MCDVQGVLPEAWPDLLRTLAGFLCPFKAMQQRQQQLAAAAAAAATATDATGTSGTAATAAELPRSATAGALLGRGLAR